MIVSSRILIGDCREKIELLDDGSIQTIITSPPYFHMRNYNDSRQLGQESDVAEYINALCDVFDKCKPKLKKTGSLFVNVNDKYEHKSLLLIPYRFAQEMIARGWVLRNQIMWFKPNFQPSPVKDRLTNTHEPIFHFVQQKKGYDYDLDPIRVPTVDRKDSPEVVKKRFQRRIETSTLEPHMKENALADLERLYEEKRIDGGSRLKLADRNIKASHGGDEKISGRAKELKEKGYYFLTNNPKGKNPGDLFSVNVKAHRSSHEAVFPAELIRPLILVSTKENDVVCDPFAGYGTTVLVANEMKRVGVGIELNRDFVTDSVEVIE